MNAAANPLQAAIYAALIADTGSGGLFADGAELVNGVFDAGGIPEGQSMPYITFGWFSSTPFRTMKRSGEDVVAEVHIWTRTGGFKSGNAILKRVNVCIGDASLSCSGYSLARSTFQDSQNLADPQSGVEHIVAHYRVLMQET